MVIDSSALIAILLDETDAPQLVEKLEQAARRRLSVANLLEAAMVIESRKGLEGGLALDALLVKAEVEIVPVDLQQSTLARKAWRTYGKGHHPASLNYGDCFAYALAKVLGSPLLYKGNDFTLTDVGNV